jgi:hypothetical protein
MPRRVHLFWGVPGLLILLVIMILALPVLLVRGQGFRDWAMDRGGVSRFLAAGQRIRIEHVDRFDPGGLAVSGVRVERPVAGGWESWLRIGNLEASWELSRLLARRLRLTSFRVDSVRVELSLMPRPLLAPAPSSGPRKPGAVPASLRNIPPIRCPELQVTHVLVRGAGGRTIMGDLELTDLRQRQGELRGVIHRVDAFMSPESLALNMSGGRVRGRLISAFQVDSLVLASNGFSGLLQTKWSQEASTADTTLLASRLTGQLSIDRLQPHEVALLRRLNLPLSARDRLKGIVAFDGRMKAGEPPRIQAMVDLAGTLFDQGLDSLVLRAAGSPEAGSLNSLRLGLGELRLDGDGEWTGAGSSATARLRFDGLDLSRAPMALWARGLPVSRLSGTVRAHADSLGPRVILTATLDLNPGTLLDRPISGFTAQGAMDPESVTVSDLRTLEPDGPALSAHGSIRRRDGHLQVDGTLRGFSLDEWVSPWIGIPLEGSVNGPFHLEGPARSMLVEADLDLRDGRVVEVTVDSLTADRIHGRLSPLSLQGELSARGVVAYKIALDSLRGHIDLAQTIRAQLTASRDTTRLDLEARITPTQIGSVLLDSLRLRPGSAPELALVAPLRLDFSPGLVKVDTLRLRSGAGGIEGSGWIRPDPAKTGNDAFAVRVRLEDLRIGPLMDFFGMSSSDVNGTGQLNLRGGGTVRAPVFDYQFTGSGLMTFGWLWERLSLAGRMGDGTRPGAGGRFAMAVDSLRGRSAGYFGEAPGLDRMGPEPPGPPFLLQADSLSVTMDRPWAEVSKLAADSLPVLVSRGEFGGCVRIKDLPVAPVLAPLIGSALAQVRTRGVTESMDPMLAVIAEVRPTPKETIQRVAGIGGRVSAAVKLGGTGIAPNLDLQLDGRNLHIYQAWADSVGLRCSLVDSLLRLQRLDWYMGSTRLHADGEWPVALGLDPPVLRLPDRPGHVTTTLAEVDLSLASLFTRVLKDPSGRLSGRVQISGTPRNLVPEGEVTIADGAFRVPAREERFSRIKADLRLDSTGVHIAQAEGRLNETGKVSATGTFRNLHDFAIEGKVRGGPVFETGNYRFLADADLTAQPIAEGDSTRPQLSGEVRVLEGLLTMDLAKPLPTAGQLPPWIPWLIELQVLAPSNIRVNQPAANLDLAQGDLHVSFRWPYWNLSGSIQVQDGTYRIFNRAVNVTSGTIEFEDTGAGPKAVLDIQAETTIPSTSGEPNARPTQVTIAVKGSPPEPLEVSMSCPTDPNLTEEQLIELMSVGQLGGAQRTSTTGQYLSSELLNQVERQLVGQLPWADRVQLQGEFGGANPMWLSVRPIQQAQWSLVYGQELSTTPGREVSIQYRLSNLFYVNTGVERKARETSGVPQDTYNLDLKFRIEY